MANQPKNHLTIHSRYKLVYNPKIEQDMKEIGEALAEEADKLSGDFVLSPILFSPDRKIYFHGGDFLPYTHLPMPWADNQLWIGQYPETREVGFSPLHCFLITDNLYKKAPPPKFFDDNIVEHAEYTMQIKKLGAKCYAAGNVSVVWPSAYHPEEGREEFSKNVRKGLKKFRGRKLLPTVNILRIYGSSFFNE